MHSTPLNHRRSLTRFEREFRLWFLVFSAATVLFGAAAMMAAGISPGLWLRNPLCWVVTLIVFMGLIRLRMPSAWVLGILVLVLVLSLMGPGQLGVHRWLGGGPVQMNVAALILPFALVLADRGARRKDSSFYAIAMLAMAGILAYQPDMSQLSALLAALLVWSAVRRKLRMLLWMVPIAVAMLLACARRPDPFAPVPYVEKILDMAWDAAPALAVCCGLCLLLTALSPLMFVKDIDRRPAAAALSAYFLVSGFAWLFGCFPVPLASYGLGFILGWMFGAAALLMGGRSTQTQS